MKIKLNDAFKQVTLDQDKILPPEETVKRFREKLKQIQLDILEDTVRIDTGRLGIPVYFSTCGKDAVDVIGTRKQMGKGATPQQAEASAVMELAERFSFFSFVKNPHHFQITTYHHVKDNAISFDDIAKSVHDESDELEVTRAFFENLPLKWTSAFNLTRGEETLIPFDWFYTINEFNGPSAGNCQEEALLQGICEIVERHVSSIISRNRLKVPGINPDSATQPMVVEMIQKYRRSGIRLFVSDFTLNTGIPTVGVLAYDPVTFPEKSEIVWTAGTSPDPQKALSRALTETAQLAGDFITKSNYVASGLPKFSHLEQADYIINPDKEVDISDLPDISHPNIRIEIENCIRTLANIQMEVFVIDTTHPLLQIPAYYTIIPGAHFRERSVGTSVGMFSAKLIAENSPPQHAIRELSYMDERLPNKYYIQFYIGMSYLQLNRPDIALEFFRKALNCNPTDQDIPSIYSYMGVCLKEMGKYKEAIQTLATGEQFDQERTDILNLMGFCHYKLKEHEQAIQCFEKILKINPSSAIDYANIGSNYRAMGNTSKAIQYYQIALMMDPSIEFAKEHLKQLHMQMD